MKAIFLVKKNPNLPGGEDNWLIMNAKEFHGFKQTKEGKERAKLMYQLDRCSEDDADIYAEVDADTFSVWKSEKNHATYVRTVNKKVGYKTIFYSQFEYENEDVDGECVLIDENASFEEAVENKVEAEKLQKFIEEMSEDDQKLINSFYFTSCPWKEEEYGRANGLSRQVVSYRRKRALQRLSKKYYHNVIKMN